MTACAISNAKLELPAGDGVDLAALAADLQHAAEALGPAGLSQAQAEGFHLYWLPGRSDAAHATRAFGRWTIQAPLPGDGNSGRLLAHELTHLALGPAHATLPLWQEEGLAEFVSYRARASLEPLAEALAIACGGGERIERLAIESEAGVDVRALSNALPRTLSDPYLARASAAWRGLDRDPATYRFQVTPIAEGSERTAAEYLGAFLAVSRLLENAPVPLDASPLELAAALPPDPAPCTSAELAEHAWNLLLDVQTALESRALAEQQTVASFAPRTRELHLGVAVIAPIVSDPSACPAARTRLGRELLHLGPPAVPR